MSTKGNAKECAYMIKQNYDLQHDVNGTIDETQVLKGVHFPTTSHVMNFN